MIHDGVNPFAEVSVGYTDDSRREDVDVLGQDVLDFEAVDIFSATDHHVFDSVYEGYKAVLIHRAEVAGVKSTLA